MMRNLEKLKIKDGVVEYNSGELEQRVRAAIRPALILTVVAIAWVAMAVRLVGWAHDVMSPFALFAAVGISFALLAFPVVYIEKSVGPKFAAIEDAWQRRSVVLDAFDLFCQLEQLGCCESELTPIWGLDDNVMFDRVPGGEKAFNAFIFRKGRATIRLDSSATHFKWSPKIGSEELVEILTGLKYEERILRSQDEDLARRRTTALWPALRSLLPKTVAQEATAPTASTDASNAPSGAPNTN